MLAPILAFAGVAAVQAGPLYQRQVSSAVSSAVSDAASSVVGAPSSLASDVSSAVVSATSAASSAVESASSAASSGVESASSAVSSASSSAAITAAPSNATTGNQSYPLFPCPTGYLLTYIQLNETVPLSVTEVVNSYGSWANSSYFPNVTTSMGGNDVGATHTINLQGVDLMETLVNATMFNTSGAARWEWNLTNGPVSAMGVSISNYSTVLSIYDPAYEQTNMIGNETTLLTYTNFCANSQAEGMQLVSALAGLELGTFAATLGGSSAGGMSSMASSSMAMTSSMASSSMEMSSSMAATSSIASSAAEATSSAASGASSVASAASSGASGVTSTIAGAVSSAISAVLPSSSA